MKKLGDREHHRIGISIYRKYHDIPDEDETEPTGESPASGAPVRTYQVLAPTAAEITDNDRGLLSGAREVRKAAVERVAARKELFMRSTDTANAARHYKSPPTPQNSLDKVFSFSTDRWKRIQRSTKLWPTTFAPQQRNGASRCAPPNVLTSPYPLSAYRTNK